MNDASSESPTPHPPHLQFSPPALLPPPSRPAEEDAEEEGLVEEGSNFDATTLHSKRKPRQDWTYERANMFNILAVQRPRMPLRKMAEMLDIGERALKKKLSELKDPYTGETKPFFFVRPRRGRTTAQLPEPLKDGIRTLLLDDVGLTLRGITELMQEDLKGKDPLPGMPKPKLNVVKKALKEMDYSSKKIIMMPREEDTPEKIVKRMHFCHSLKDLPVEQMLFLDARSFNPHVSPAQGWSARGDPAYSTRPSSRASNVTLILIIGINGVVAWECITGSVSGSQLETVITQHLAPRVNHKSSNSDSSCTNHTLIIGTATMKRTSGLEEAVEKLNVSKAYLPPLSPHLNPCEEVFLALKSAYRSVKPTPENAAELKERID